MNDNKNTNSSKCSKCGVEYVSVQGDGIMGQKCPQCGEWGIITTYFPDYCYDETNYTINILPCLEISREHMKYIAKKCNINYMKVKQNLAREKMFLEKGKARDLKELILELNDKKIKYEIVPEFKWKF